MNQQEFNDNLFVLLYDNIPLTDSGNIITDNTEPLTRVTSSIV